MSVGEAAGKGLSNFADLQGTRRRITGRNARKECWDQILTPLSEIFGVYFC